MKSIKKFFFSSVRNDTIKFKKYLVKGKTKNKLIKRIYYFKLKRLETKYNCFIPLNVNIKDSVVFPHGLHGIFILSGAIVGENCVIFHQVTIGSNTLKDSKGSGSPIIGNNVYIGAGAKIIGNVKIGDNVRIGANCVVVKDVEPNSTVVLSENRIIKHKEKLDNKFVSWNDRK